MPKKKRKKQKREQGKEEVVTPTPSVLSTQECGYVMASFLIPHKLLKKLNVFVSHCELEGLGKVGGDSVMVILLKFLFAKSEKYGPIPTIRGLHIQGSDD